MLLFASSFSSFSFFCRLEERTVTGVFTVIDNKDNNYIPLFFFRVVNFFTKQKCYCFTTKTVLSLRLKHNSKQAVLLRRQTSLFSRHSAGVVSCTLYHGRTTIRQASERARPLHPRTLEQAPVAAIIDHQS